MQATEVAALQADLDEARGAVEAAAKAAAAGTASKTQGEHTKAQDREWAAEVAALKADLGEARGAAKAAVAAVTGDPKAAAAIVASGEAEVARAAGAAVAEREAERDSEWSSMVQDMRTRLDEAQRESEDALRRANGAEDELLRLREPLDASPPRQLSSSPMPTPEVAA